MSNSELYSLSLTPDMDTNDLHHFKSNVNYLFRTDRNQKWTSEATRYNFFLIFDDEGRSTKKLMLMSDDFDDRELLSERVRSLLEIYNGKKVTDDSVILKSLKMVLGEYPEVPFALFDERMIMDVDEIADALLKTEKLYPVCIVAHNDQPKSYLHIHILAVNLTGKDVCESLIESQQNNV